MLRFIGPALLLILAGCGSGTPAPPDYGGNAGAGIAELIDQLDEAKTSPTRLKMMFAGTPPPNLKDYAKFLYDLKGQVTESGATATALVSVRKDFGEVNWVEKEWAFVKEGDRWKLKDAPLP